MGSLSCCCLSPGGGGQVVFAEAPDSEGFESGFLFHVPEGGKVKAGGGGSAPGFRKPSLKERFVHIQAVDEHHGQHPVVPIGAMAPDMNNPVQDKGREEVGCLTAERLGLYAVSRGSFRCIYSGKSHHDLHTVPRSI